MGFPYPRLPQFNPDDPNLTPEDWKKRFHDLLARAERAFGTINDSSFHAGWGDLTWEELRKKEEWLITVYFRKRDYIRKTYAVKYEPDDEDNNKRARIDHFLSSHVIEMLQRYRDTFKSRRKERNQTLALPDPQAAAANKAQEARPSRQVLERLEDTLNSCIEDLSNRETVELRHALSSTRSDAQDDSAVTLPQWNIKQVRTALLEDLAHQEQRFSAIDNAKHYLIDNRIAVNPLTELKHIRRHVTVFTPIYQVALVHTIAEAMKGEAFKYVPQAAAFIDKNKTKVNHPYDVNELDNLLSRVLTKKGTNWVAPDRNDIAHPNNVKMRMLAGMLYCERHLEQAHKEDPSTDRSAKGEVRLLLQSYEHMEVDTEELLGEILRLPDRVHHPPVWQVQEHIQYWPNYADAFTSERLKATAQRLAPVSACPPTSPLAPASPLPSASPSRTAPPQPPPAPKANAPSTSATSGGNLAPPQMGRPRAQSNRGPRPQKSSTRS